MRVVRRPQFDRELGRVPAPVREWALDWIDAADAPDATLSGVLKGSEGLKGGTFRNYYVRKWRRKGQGEHRLVFMAEGETVTFVHLGPREDDYKTAARRARTMRGPAGD